MAAVATVLGLLLVVSFIASYVLVDLPNQMQQAEFDHTLLVENQLGALQSSILAQAGNPGMPVSVLSPVTLGSSAVPPFAPASDGSLQPEPNGTQVGLAYSYSRFVSAPPAWNASPGCPPTGHPCNSGTSWDNITGAPNSTYTFKLNGGAPSFVFNFTGNNDTISITWLGKSVGFVYMIFNGSFLHVTMTKGSNGGAGTSPFIVTTFYGQNDVLETGLNGAGITMLTRFFGSTNGQLCPVANLSNSDSFYWNATSNTNTNVTVDWLNSIGYSSGPTSFTVGTGSTLTFQNITQFPGGCAWTKAFTANYLSTALSGVRVHLNNRYSPPADLLYDQGAVILSHPGLGSIMVAPPRITASPVVGGGWLANLTIVNVEGSFVDVAGTQTTGVVSHVQSIQTYVINGQPLKSLFLTGVLLTLTTPYPNAWDSFFDTLPGGPILGPVACTPLGTLTPGTTCLVPPAGVSSRLTVPLNLVTLAVEVVNVQITVV